MGFRSGLRSAGSVGEAHHDAQHAAPAEAHAQAHLEPQAELQAQFQVPSDPGTCPGGDAPPAFPSPVRRRRNASLSLGLLSGLLRRSPYGLAAVAGVFGLVRLLSAGPGLVAAQSPDGLSQPVSSTAGTSSSNWSATSATSVNQVGGQGPALTIPPLGSPSAATPAHLAPLSSSLPPTAGVDDTSTLELSGLQARFDQVAREVSPSVVAISVAIESRGDDDSIRPDDMSGRKLTGILDRTTRTVGTGFIISPDGLILTNEHVIAEAEQIWCTTDDGRILPAFVVGSDPRQDLAVLSIPASGLKAVTFADTATVRRGNWAIALGNPYGLAGEGRLAMAVGIVSATGRSLPRLSTRENRLYTDLIQTTAEINPGNSGGPLFDLSGRVFGINTAVVLPQKNTNGIGFALPVTPALLAKVEDLRQGREVVYGELAVSVVQPSQRQRRSAGLMAEIGVLVDHVEPEGPAAGVLVEGDVVVSLDDQPVSGIDSFTTLAASLRGGTPARVGICRAGEILTVAITPRRKPVGVSGISRSTQRYRWNGLLLGPIPPNWTFNGKPRPDYGLMIFAVDNSKPLKTLGGTLDLTPTPGTILQSVGGRPVHSIADLQNLLASLPPEQTGITLYPPRPVPGGGQTARDAASRSSGEVRAISAAGR